MNLDRVSSLLSRRIEGHSLPREFYRDPEVFEFDLEAIFARNWVMVGFECEIGEKPGSYLATEIGLSPVVILRAKDGTIAGFNNSCRHRGAQICPSGAGRTPRLTCNYHKWTYDLSGNLLAAPGSNEGFDRDTHGLIPIRVETVAGCLYASLSDNPPDFSEFRAALEPCLAPFNLQDGKIAYSVDLEEDANWKLVMENGRECLHCASCHPELQITFPVSIGDANHFEEGGEQALDDRMRALGLYAPRTIRDWWQISRLPFNEGKVSYALDDNPLVSVPLIDVPEDNLGSLRFAIEPNNFAHVTKDCAIMVSCNPVGPVKSVITAKWLVHKDAVEGVDYDIDRLIHMWDATNRQDKELAENNQRGVNGHGYRPGPYSKEREPLVRRFIDWYCEQSSEFLGQQDASAAQIGLVSAP